MQGEMMIMIASFFFVDDQPVNIISKQKTFVYSTSRNQHDATIPFASLFLTPTESTWQYKVAISRIGIVDNR